MSKPPDPSVFRDRVTNADPRRVANASMAVLNGLQDFDGPSQLIAAAVVFQQITEKYALPPGTVFEVATNIQHEKQQLRPEFGAVRDYVKELV